MKMYKQPKTDIIAFQTENMMDMTTMSPAGGNGPGATEAPKRRGDIID